MSRGKWLFVWTALLASCSGASSGSTPTSGPVVTDTDPLPTTIAGIDTDPPPTTIAASDSLPPTTTMKVDEGVTAAEREAARRQFELVVTGPEEVVFDWTTDRCEDEHIPDIAARAIRSADGTVRLSVSHYITYWMTGPDLDTLATDCSVPALTSGFDPDPSQFNDSEWLGGVYTADGETVYAIVHNEYRGVTHQAAISGQCPSNENLTCLDTSLTMAVSTDGGVTFEDTAPPPENLIASLPYVFDDEGVPSGYRQPSNIIAAPDGYFYVFTSVIDYPERPGDFEPQWLCLMRTDDLADPTSWRYWNGADFIGEFRDPYREVVDTNTDKCAPIGEPQVTASMTDSVTWDEVIGKYVLVGIDVDSHEVDGIWGVYYALSDDLITWTRRQLLLEVPVNASVDNDPDALIYAYPTLIDPDSLSPSFATTDGSMYLYLPRFNFGGNSLDRDLTRFPVQVQEVTVPIPVWEFETDGDDEGWIPDGDIAGFGVTDGALSLESTGSDPYMFSPSISVPALGYDKVLITMRVTADGPTSAELFFVTDVDADYDEAKRTDVSFSADGEFHTYEFDMANVPGWDGRVTQIRLDPVTHAATSIDIDRITFGF